MIQVCCNEAMLRVSTTAMLQTSDDGHTMQGTTYIQCKNQSVISNNKILESRLRNKNHSIAYRFFGRVLLEMNGKRPM